MVFLANDMMSIPTTDLVSWMFDDLPYDPDKPVSPTTYLAISRRKKKKKKHPLNSRLTSEPHNKIYIDDVRPERSLSANQARRLIRKLAAGFRRCGIRPGQKDVVLVNSFNDVMYPMLFLGIIAAGGIFTGSNPSYTPYELAHQFRTSETRYIITEPEMLQPILAAAKECSIPPSNIFIFDVLGQDIPHGFRSWQTLLDHGEEDWVRFDDLQTASTTEIGRFYSSGTTGLPKAAMLTHHNFVAEHTLTWANDSRDYDVRRLLCLPMFHMALAPTSHTTTIKSGQLGIVMRRFEMTQFLTNIEKYQINELAVAPPLVIAVIMSPITKNYSLKSVRSAACGAAPLDKGPQKRFEALLGDGAVCTQVFGNSSPNKIS